MINKTCLSYPKRASSWERGQKEFKSQVWEIGSTTQIFGRDGAVTHIHSTVDVAENPRTAND